MRLISKNIEPTAFAKWKRANPAATFDTLGNGKNHFLKQQVKASLLVEQYFVCCYCENTIDPSNSHIEHLHPQQDYKKEQLEYSNLMASCEADGKKAHCGHKKDAQLLPISPLGPDDPSPNFVYSADGNIYPHPEDNKSASKTISILGLNARRLINMRKAAISALEFFPKEEYEQITAKLSPNSRNELPAFVSALLYQINTGTTRR